MRKVTMKLIGSGTLAQGKFYDVPKLDRELSKDYEIRTWRERAHYNNDGKMIIPPMALKNCLSEAAKFLGLSIPGKGKSTYTKHFEAGIMVVDELLITPEITRETVQGQWLFVPSDGKRGGSKRVNKCFPIVNNWEATADIYILDEIITEDVLERHLDIAGKFIGLGSFRPRNNGMFGRFEVEDITWD